MGISIQRIAVIGAGTMGHGIAQMGAQAGFQVWLHDTHDLLEQARKRIGDNLARGVQLGKLTAADRDATLSRINLTDDLLSAVADVGLVIESVVEDLVAKQKLFEAIESATWMIQPSNLLSAFLALHLLREIIQQTESVETE